MRKSVVKKTNEMKQTHKLNTNYKKNEILDD